MITPKETFKKTAKDRGWQWLDVVDSEAFHNAVNAALLQMALDNNAPPDMATAASYQWRMEGAKQVIRTLMNLTTAPESRAQVPGVNLNHRA